MGQIEYIKIEPSEGSCSSACHVDLINLISFLSKGQYLRPFSTLIQDFGYLYDPNNETAGAFVPAQILYDAFHGRYNSSAGAIILLFVIWGSFFFGGLSITTSAARVVSTILLFFFCLFIRFGKVGYLASTINLPPLQLLEVIS